MTRFSCLLAAIVMLLTGCSRAPEAVVAAKKQDPGGSGRIILPADSPKLREIRVAPVQLETVPSVVVTAPGKVEVNPNRVAHVLLPVGGRIVNVLVKVGDAVRQGEPLLELESPDADAAMSNEMQAEAGLNQARANQRKAQSDYDRTKELFEHDAVAKKELLSAENALAQAQAANEQAEATVKQAARRLEMLGLKAGAFGQRVRVNAPISGKILEMNMVPGEYRNDLSAPLATIADLSTVWVSADVPESEIRLVRPGEPVEIELSAFPGQVFRGRVMKIADMVDATTRTVKVRSELDNSHGLLRPEMYGRFRHVDTVERLPVVPAAAVIQGEGQTMVYVETAPGQFEQRRLQVGERAGDVLPVRAGLEPGEKIVVDGAMLLRTNE